jgi:O-antigen/teichoic acid export membrane protein
MMSVIRGYFQGKNNMIPTAVSQVIEQFVRISFILISGYILIKIIDDSYVTAVSYAVRGTVFSAFIGFGVLMYFLISTKKDRDFKRKYESVGNPAKVSSLVKELFFVAIPFAIYGINFSLYQFIDSITFNKALIMRGIENPEFIYGIYAFEVQKIIFIPISLSVVLSSVLIPTISYDYSKNNLSGVDKNIIKAFQILFFFTFPVVIYTMIFNQQIYYLLFGNNEYGAKILHSYAPLIIIFSVNSVSMSIVQGINKHKYLFFTIFLGVLIKGLTNYIFIMYAGVDGAILSTALGILTTVTLNMAVIQHHTMFEFNYLLKRFLLIILISSILGTILIFLDKLLANTFVYDNSKFNSFIYLFISSIIAVVLYFVLSLYTGLIRVITESRITFEKIISVLKKTNNDY